MLACWGVLIARNFPSSNKINEALSKNHGPFRVSKIENGSYSSAFFFCFWLLPFSVVPICTSRDVAYISLISSTCLVVLNFFFRCQTLSSLLRRQPSSTLCLVWLVLCD